jgi:maltokinase
VTAPMSSIDAERITGDLREWLPAQRWFAGKNRPVRAVRLADSVELVDGDPQLLHAVVEVEHTDGSSDRYQLLLGVRSDLPDHLGHGSIGTTGGRTVYDAVHDQELTRRLLELITAEAKVDGLQFGVMPDAELDPSLRSRPVGAEQSNTSLIYGQRYILKLFRRLQPGLSPDLELHKALHEVGSEHIATPYGWITGELDGEPTTLGMLGEFLPNAADGWAMATASVRDLMAEADLHANEVGGDFAGESHRLGHAVAAVHAELDQALGHSEADVELLAATAQAMHERLHVMVRTVPELAAHQDALRAAFDAVGTLDGRVRLQRIHGDLHLGQVLRTPRNWVLIDFEGEPAAPVARRREPGSPLRDVAGMLRSFDYAAHQMVVGHHDHGERQLAFRALEWAQRNREAFCDGYAEVAGDPRRHATLLRALELDKAVYEVGYEAAHRPDWLAIPLSAIERMTEE